MKIDDLQHSTEITRAEQELIRGGWGWIAVGLIGMALHDGYKSLTKTVDTEKVSNHVIAGAIKAS